MPCVATHHSTNHPEDKRSASVLGENPKARLLNSRASANVFAEDKKLLLDDTTEFGGEKFAGELEVEGEGEGGRLAGAALALGSHEEEQSEEVAASKAEEALRIGEGK